MIKNEDHSLTLRVTLPKKKNEADVHLCFEKLGVLPVRLIKREDFVLALMPDHATLEQAWNAGRDGRIVLRPGKPASEVKALDKETEHGLIVRRRDAKKTELSERKDNFSAKRKANDQLTLLLFALPQGCLVEDIENVLKEMDIAPKRVRVNAKGTTSYVLFENMHQLEAAWINGKDKQICVNNKTLPVRAADDDIEAGFQLNYNRKK